MAENAGNVVINLDINPKPFNDGLERVTKDAEKAGDEAGKRFGETLQKGLTRFADWGQNIAASFLGFGLKVAAELEVTEVGIRNLGVEASEASRLVDRLRSASVETPFTPQQLAKGSQMFLAFEKDVDKVIGSVLSLGDAVSAAGVGQAEFDRFAYNLRQVASMSFLSARDLREFQNNLPIFDEMIKSAGLSLEDLTSSADPARLILYALNKASEEGGIVHGAMKERLDTLAGSIDAAKSQWALLTEEGVKSNGVFDHMKTIMQGITQLLKDNGQAVTGFVSAVGAVAGIIGVFIAASSAINTMRGAMVALGVAAKNTTLYLRILTGATLVGALLTLAYAFYQVTAGAKKFQEGLKDTDSEAGKTEDSLKSVNEMIAETGKRSAETGSRISDLNDRFAKLNRDFMERLGEIVRARQKSVEDIKSALADEQAAYSQQQSDRDERFARQSEDMTASHKKKTDEIKKQIHEEVYSETEANQVRLDSLRAKLADEESEYKKNFKRLNDDYKKDTARAKEQHTVKVKDLKTRLAEELAFLKKHNADVKAVTGQRVLDEIELLRRRTTEQLKELTKQKNQEISTATAINNELDKLRKQQAAKAIKDVENQGTALTSAIAKQVARVALIKKQGFKFDEKSGDYIFESPMGAQHNLIYNPKSNVITGQYAEGTNYAQGGWSLVGERGPELVNLPRGSQVIPNHKLGSAGGVTINNTNIFNRETDTDAFSRKLAFQLGVV